jgi:hypothetical protein
MMAPRWALAAGFLAVGCGGSKPPADDADDADFGEQRVSEEQNKNEVDPFFEGDSNRGTQKVDLQDDAKNDDPEAESE